jgi:hypothetical protein
LIILMEVENEKKTAEFKRKHGKRKS